jgi:hypothetical protein
MGVLKELSRGFLSCHSTGGRSGTSSALALHVGANASGEKEMLGGFMVEVIVPPNIQIQQFDWTV